ncbi:MAG: DUF6090 family protein, partial [Bacteroidota bacterium]
MIKTFRKIRQRLLSENKFNKYLLYAFGEIVLVVIGILIALQINGWNESKLQRQREQDYLNDISTFLLEDKENVIQLKSYYEKKAQVYDSISTLFDREYTSRDIANLFLPYMQSTSAFQLFNINSTAFDNMMSSTDISIVNNKMLRHKLSFYYSQNTMVGVQERIQKSTRAFRDFFVENFTTKEL